MESLKAFISRQDDGGVRMAYARRPEPQPRRCILVGTTNSDSCLPNDPSGLRRFVPVMLGPQGCDVARTIPPIREQLWAEAMDWYRTRDPEDDGQLPRSLHLGAAEKAERYRSRDAVIEDALADYSGRMNAPKTLAEIAVGWWPVCSGASNARRAGRPGPRSGSPRRASVALAGAIGEGSPAPAAEFLRAAADRETAAALAPGETDPLAGGAGVLAGHALWLVAGELAALVAEVEGSGGGS